MTASANEYRIFFRVVKVMSAVRLQITVCLWKRFYIVTVLAFPGVTCLSALVNCFAGAKAA